MKRATLEALVAARAARAPCALVSRLRDGAQRLIRPADAPAGVFAELGRAALADGRSGVRGEGDEACACVVFAPPARLVIVGAVHIGAKLATLADALGYAVEVCDPRPAFVEAWPAAAVPAREGWLDRMEDVALDSGVAVATLTHDPKIDDPALIRALNAGCGYVGALGSRKTHAARRERLAARGLAPEALDAIHAPIGLAIGALDAGEIALSVLAQVVAVRRRAGGAR